MVQSVPSITRTRNCCIFVFTVSFVSTCLSGLFLALHGHNHEMLATLRENDYGISQSNKTAQGKCRLELESLVICWIP